MCESVLRLSLFLCRKFYEGRFLQLINSRKLDIWKNSEEFANHLLFYFD